LDFLQKNAVADLSKEAKQALRAASVFLTATQRKAVTSFLQAPGNYNAQSGEITGILKNMNDTFTANLQTARDEEAKQLSEYTKFMTNARSERSTLRSRVLSNKDIIGDAASTISDTDSQRSQKVTEKEDNEAFLATLTTRCETKKAEFDKRNMLRTNEEAAIAQAIAILNSDSSFEVFGNTQTSVDQSRNVGGRSLGGGRILGRFLFLQMSSVIHRKNSLTSSRAVRAKVIKSLLSVAKTTKSLRLARAISSLSATNPFEEVVKEIRGVIDLIDKEEEADVNKKNWCDQEESEKTDAQSDQQTDLGTLRTNIANLQVAVGEAQTNIEQGEEDLASNKDAQASETNARSESHAVFQSNLNNLQNAQSILTKAIEVLTKYYDFLAASTADHHYDRRSNVDSGGSNLEQIKGNPSVDDLKAECSKRPDCMGFNTAGWLKSAIAPSSEWYDWDGGDLYVKDFEEGRLATGRGRLLRLVQQTPHPDVEDGPEFSEGGEGGNRAINMLEFIRSETKDEADNAMDNEKTSQMQYETNMQALSTAAEGLDNSIASYKDDKARLAKRLEQAQEDEASTEKELDTTTKYLAEIEPGCTFIQSNLGTRQAARQTEKSALEGAINTLEASPAYQNFAASQESEDLGACSDICNGEKDTMTAECQACQEGVTVFGYCSQADKAASVSGCSGVTDTGSADAMNVPAAGGDRILRKF